MTRDEVMTGHILGVVDSYDAVHSKFTGDDCEFHADNWPTNTHCKWRWFIDDGVYFNSWDVKPDDFIIESIIAHITKKYGIPHHENGMPDLEKINQIFKK